MARGIQAPQDTVMATHSFQWSCSPSVYVTSTLLPGYADQWLRAAVSTIKEHDQKSKIINALTHAATINHGCSLECKMMYDTFKWLISVCFLWCYRASEFSWTPINIYKYIEQKRKQIDFLRNYVLASFLLCITNFLCQITMTFFTVLYFVGCIIVFSEAYLSTLVFSLSGLI